MMRHAVIPARFASSRLHGKPLLHIHGQPMILRVVAKVSQALKKGIVDDVCVATDDQNIANICRDAGYDVVMTADNHPSGTDRLAEVVQKKGWADDDIVVNVQGDEPLIPEMLIAQVANLLLEQPDCAMATLAEPIICDADFLKPSVVKVVMAKKQALYFSRAPIPHQRDSDLTKDQTNDNHPPANQRFRHLGLYAYKVAMLKDFVTWSVGKLEAIECLEQLRVLENGAKIAIDIAEVSLPAGVDTQADLDRLNQLDADLFC